MVRAREHALDGPGVGLDEAGPGEHREERVRERRPVRPAPGVVDAHVHTSGPSYGR